ncbi:homeobox protein knotted-1-like protein, partial [Striga asiatica]
MAIRWRVSPGEGTGATMSDDEDDQLDDSDMNLFDGSFDGADNIIAEVIKIDEVVKYERGGHETTRLNTSRGETMECTLWNQFAIQMLDFWKSKKDEPVVIILHYAMVKRWGAQVNLQNSHFASKFIINEDMDEIVKFMK